MAGHDAEQIKASKETASPVRRTRQSSKNEEVKELLDDRGSATSKEDGGSSHDGVSGSRGFAEAPLSPPASTHSSSNTSSSQDKLPPLRPAYLYVDGQDAEPPEEPTDDLKGVPVFTPTWEEFQDFYSYCTRIDEWGMHSGIVKIIPPKEWTEALPRLDGRAAGSSKAGERYTDSNRLSQVRIKNSIEQLFTPAGMGVWRQSNVVHPARIVNAKQWADVCAQEGQRGPEMQRMKEVSQRKEADEEEDGVRTRSGRGKGTGGGGASLASSSKHTGDEANSKTANGKVKMAERTTQREWDELDYERDWSKEGGQDARPEDWSMATCRAIEEEYWRGLNYGKPPMYGADLAGTLFTPETKHWNVGQLDNILTRLRLKRKLPGVTTPYLYFGMWRATFAWHVEDMDLYSINYIHFGAPKQWYSIRQADKQRFELAMAAAFPADSSRCRHFMRHKSYLASPAFLKSAAGSVKPLRLVQKAQEIVITYPYGYHSGYNLGFNCAESVNFALERWLEIGRKAGYCDCTNDSVKMDVDAMLEESREMEELDRKKVEREKKREEEDMQQKTEEEKAEIRRAKERERRKRRKEEDDRLAGLGILPVKKSMERSEQPYPCEFCPSTLKEDLVLIHTANASDKKRAHRLCASFLPETWVAPNPKGKTPKEVVMGIEGIPRARWTIKCQVCKDPAMQKRGAKVQCTYGRCSRTSHVSCALLEENGWKLDVLSVAEANEVEGKTAVGKGGRKSVQATPSAEDDDDDDRMVVLCRTHNPEERVREAKRKAAVVREVLGELVKGDKICIRTTSGVWETIFERFEPPAIAKDTTDEGEVVLIDGSRILGGKVVIDLATFRKADDKIWYREEAEWLQEEAERKRGKKRKHEGEESGESNVEAVKIEAEDPEAEVQPVSLVQATPPAADVKKQSKEKKQRRTKSKAEKQNLSLAANTVAPTAPPNNELQYIRDWRPRISHEFPPQQPSYQSTMSTYHMPFASRPHEIRSWKPMQSGSPMAGPMVQPMSHYPVHPSYARPQPAAEMRFLQEAEARARNNAWIAQQRYHANHGGEFQYQQPF
jgi:hypothetical protein